MDSNRTQGSPGTGIDRAIGEFDQALRAVLGVHEATRPTPAASSAEAPLTPEERLEAAALMRVNHAGEVCAQALYQGQALTARDPRNRAALEQAALEEQDHLAWCAQRIRELGGRTSALNPFWYAGAFAAGFAAGALGDRWSLAFLAETEHQVEAHLAGHLERLSPADGKTRSVVAAMREDEAKHRESARHLGAVELPEPVKQCMRAMAKVMTTVAHRV
jgi:3-demethoxyubiquinol 3-hydroxylase